MRIDKAIEILIQDREEVLDCPLADLKAAKQLGIEGLKREREYRITAPIMNIVLLPGETE